MYRSISDFISDFSEDCGEMSRNFGQLTEAALSTRATSNGYTLGELALHLLNSWPGVLAQAGEPLPFEQLPDTATAAEIAAGWTRLCELVPQHIAATWSDAKLSEAVTMWGMPWTKAKVLWEMMKHTVHHHGQMTVLLRLAGLPVHGIYGPSQEETAGMSSGS